MDKTKHKKVTCANCSHAIFDPLFGEYKCDVCQARVMPGYVTCFYWEKGTPKLSGKYPDYYDEEL